MKRNTKAVFTAFNAAIVSGFAAAGIHPSGVVSYHEETPEFTIETRGGTYVFHHDSNIDPDDPRPLNFCSVFGRFLDPKAGYKIVDCNPYSGKWNFDGHCHVATVQEAQSIAADIVSRILKISTVASESAA